MSFRRHRAIWLAYLGMIVLHEEGHLDCNEVAAATAFRNPKIDFVWNSTLEEIKGRDEVEGLVIKNVVTGTSNEVETDGIFFFVGMIPQTELIRDLVECDDKGYIDYPTLAEAAA